MQVHVKNGLTTVDACVGDDAITAVGDTFFDGDLTRHRQHMSRQRFILGLQTVNRFDVLVRHDQDMCWRNGVNVAESGHLFIAVNNVGLNFIVGNFADDARVSHG